MSSYDFDLASWIEGPRAEAVLASWDRERHANLPTYRLLWRDAALEYGRSCIAAIAALARGDAAIAQTLARRLIEDGAARGCPPSEVVAAFQTFQRVFMEQLAESQDVPLEAGGRLTATLLACSNALSDALAHRLEGAQQETARARAAAQRLRQDRDNLMTLLQDDVRGALDAASTALASAHVPGGPAPARGDASSDPVVDACQALDRLRDRAARLGEVGRLERGSSLSRIRTSLHELLSRIARDWQNAAQGRSITIDLEEDDAQVPVDVALLSRALDGCMENALRFTPRGGRIRIGAKKEEERALITIWDSGPPIHPESREKAFGKYWTGDGHPGGGRGLGLYLCRMVAEHHGGRAWADDEDGCCAFHVALPLSPSPEPSQINS